MPDESEGEKSLAGCLLQTRVVLVHRLRVRKQAPEGSGHPVAPSLRYMKESATVENETGHFRFLFEVFAATPADPIGNFSKICPYLIAGDSGGENFLFREMLRPVYGLWGYQSQ